MGVSNRRTEQPLASAFADALWSLDARLSAGVSRLSAAVGQLIVGPFSTMWRFLPFSLLLLLSGCTREVTRSGLDAKATEHAGFTFPDQTYYIGSESGYDYFFIRSGMGGSSHRYRVLESEGAVTNRFGVTKDETRWRGYGITGIVVTNASQIVLPK
jgi:hypothetical protein